MWEMYNAIIKRRFLVYTLFSPINGSKVYEFISSVQKNPFVAFSDFTFVNFLPGHLADFNQTKTNYHLIFSSQKIKDMKRNKATYQPKTAL